MQINIKATNLDLTEEIKDYIFKKIGALDKFLPDENKESAQALFEIGKKSGQQKGDVFHADCLIESVGERFYASTDREEVFQAIDEVRDILFGELGRKKNKKLAMFHRGARKIKEMMRSATSYRPWKK